MKKNIYCFIVIFIIVAMLSVLPGCNAANPAQTTPAAQATSAQTTSAQATAAAATTEIKNTYGDNLATDKEDILFSFKIADSAKTLSICTSKASAGDPDYIVYRFGTKDSIELEFPKSLTGSWSQFTYSYYLRGGGKGNSGMDLNYLSFENEGYQYKVYQEYTAEDDATKVGVKVTDKATNKITDIKGVSSSIKGNLINLRGNSKIRTETLQSAGE